MFFLHISTLDWFFCPVRRNVHFFIPVVFSVDEKTDTTEHSWSSGDVIRHTHTHTMCTAHLICGNGGSSDEGRDGGLCDHAVGGDAVRRRVESERGQIKKTNSSLGSNTYDTRSNVTQTGKVLTRYFLHEKPDF